MTDTPDTRYNPDRLSTVEADVRLARQEAANAVANLFATIEERIKGVFAIIEERNSQYEQRFIGQEKAVAAALTAAKEAVAFALIAAKESVVKAEAAVEKRFDGVNEFRGQLSDQAATFLPRLEADVMFKAVSDKITALTDLANANRSRLDIRDGGSKGISAVTAAVISGLSLLIAIAAVVLSYLRH